MSNAIIAILSMVSCWRKAESFRCYADLRTKSFLELNEGDFSRLFKVKVFASLALKLNFVCKRTH